MAFSQHFNEIILESERHHEHDESKCELITDDDIIYNSNFIEEKSSLIDPDHWHDNDLFVAAELGKSLLERNRKLESHVVLLKNIVESQQSEIGLLRKQFNAFRELNRNNVHLYEDVERQCQKLEKKNKRLQAENHAEKHRCQTLSEMLATLESTNEDLRRQLQDAHNNEQMLKKSFNSTTKLLRKTVSVSNIPDGLSINETIRKNLSLHNRIGELQQHCHHEHRLRVNLESELQIQRESSEAQKERLQVLERMLAERCDNFSKHSCPSKENNSELLHEVEHDQVQLVHACHVGRLCTGGSVYSSRESLNKVGAGLLDETEVTFDRHDDNENNSNISFLFELQNKYSEILEQYQSLLENKSFIEQQERFCKLSQEETINFEARLDAIFDKESRTKRKQLVQDDYKPKYKDLFREVFSTLKEIKERI